jgi:glycolate oxidase
VVQCGVRNLAISEAAAPLGLYYAPDPVQPDRLHHRRQRGRKLGRRALPEIRPDLHNVLKVKGFTIEGEPVEFGSAALDAPGYDLLPLVVGSEGMLAVTTEVTVKLVPKPHAGALHHGQL